MECPFCALPQSTIIDGNELAMVVRDRFPVSEGHTLVIPRRHVTSFFEITALERGAMWLLLERAKSSLDRTLGAAGYNIGINDGVAAGQTVMHLHIHLIPRYLGDIEDPRGGVRWVMPHKADYWSTSN